MRLSLFRPIKRVAHSGPSPLLHVTTGLIVLLVLGSGTGMYLYGEEEATPTLVVSARLKNPDLERTIGDQIDILVTLIYPETLSSPVLVPDFPEEFVLVTEESGKLIQKGTVTEEERLVRLAAFKTGTLSVGPIRYSSADSQNQRLEGLSSPLEIEIKTVLSPEEKEPSPPEEPWIVPYPAEKLVILILTAVIVILTVVLLWYLRRKGRGTLSVKKPVTPPHLEAKNKLYQLFGQDLPSKGKTKLMFYMASEIIKDFLGKELALVILERTTSEIVAQVSEIQFLSGTNAEDIGQLLVFSDGIKFAKYHPTEAEIDEWQRKALRLVNDVHEASLKFRTREMRNGAEETEDNDDLAL